MSVIGFIINGVRHGSYIAPEWWPDAGTCWNGDGGVEQRATRVESWVGGVG
jgi:hypothetical protein